MSRVPKLSGSKPKQSKGRKPQKKKAPPKASTKRKRGAADEQVDEVVVAGVTPIGEEAPEEEVKQMPVVEQAIPFSDGITASCLSNLVVISKVGGAEVDLLRSFLKYFATTETFIGAISSKTSFMKRKGGMLL